MYIILRGCCGNSLALRTFIVVVPPAVETTAADGGDISKELERLAKAMDEDVESPEEAAVLGTEEKIKRSRSLWLVGISSALGVRYLLLGS